MDGNKLKHKFVKKEKQLETNDWVGHRQGTQKCTEVVYTQ